MRTLSPTAEIRVGAQVRLSGTSLCAREKIVIGDRCTIGANVTIADTDFHALDPRVRSSPNDLALSESAPVEIGDDAFIGAGAYILKGVTVGDAAVIGAGSVVTRCVAPRQIVAGNPAREVGTLNPVTSPALPA
jgi:acetyltransferase-like isoleucine patch superfamily enzyme